MRPRNSSTQLETLAGGPRVDEPVHLPDHLVAVFVDRRADLHRRRSAKQRLDRGGPVVDAGRNGDVQLRERMGAQRRAAQDVAQFARLAERIAVHQAHLLDVDVRLEKAVIRAPVRGPAAASSASPTDSTFVRRIGSFTDTGIVTSATTLRTMPA